MISVAIQHHPARAELLEQLVERLGGAEVVSDPEPDGKPSPMRCYRECLRRTPAEAPHRVVVQDDAWPCDGFREKAEAAIAERPDQILAFFVPGTPAGGMNRIFRAAKDRDSWAQIGGMSILPLVATCWPKALAEQFLEFSERPRWRDRTGDDAVGAAFVKQNRMEVWATVPSIVQHLDREPSLIGKTAKAGKNRARVAALFAD